MRTISGFLAGVLIAGSLAIHCSSDNAGSASYLAYSDPDNLLTNLERVWKNRDLSEYRTGVLYDGKAAGRSGLLHPAFTFYVSKKGDRAEAERAYGYEQEVIVAGAMFGRGTNEPESRSVSSLELVLDRLDDWERIPAGKEILGDSCPEGTETCRIGGTLRITLAPAEGETEEARRSVRYDGRVYIIPVRDPGSAGEAYRLWKWIDFTGNRS